MRHCDYFLYMTILADLLDIGYRAEDTQSLNGHALNASIIVNEAARNHVPSGIMAKLSQGRDGRFVDTENQHPPAATPHGGGVLVKSTETETEGAYGYVYDQPIDGNDSAGHVAGTVEQGERRVDDDCADRGGFDYSNQLQCAGIDPEAAIEAEKVKYGDLEEDDQRQGSLQKFLIGRRQTSLEPEVIGHDE